MSDDMTTKFDNAMFRCGRCKRPFPLRAAQLGLDVAYYDDTPGAGAYVVMYGTCTVCEAPFTFDFHRHFPEAA